MKQSIAFLLAGFLSIPPLFSQNYDWTVTVGGVLPDIVLDMWLDEDQGNVFLFGGYRDTVDFDPGPGVSLVYGDNGESFYLAKYDTNGVYQWAFGVKDAKGQAATQDTAGNIYITGNYHDSPDFNPGAGVDTLPFSAAQGYVFMAKYDVNGNFIWVKGMNGTDLFVPRDIAVGPSGNIYLSGVFKDTVDFDPGPGVDTLINPQQFYERAFLAKYTGNGELIWVTDKRQEWISYGGRLAVNANEEIYMAGGLFQVAYLDKYDSTGYRWWSRTTPGASLEALKLDANGELITTGSFEQTVDFHPGAATLNRTATGIVDVFVVQYDTAGYPLQVNTIGGTHSVQGKDVSLGSDGSMYVTGTFNYTADFDPGPGVVSYTSAGVTSADIFIQKLDAQGQLIWVRTIGDHFGEYVAGIAISPAGQVYTAGNFSDTVDFDPGIGTDIRNITGSNPNYADLFLHKMRQDACSNLGLSIDSAINLDCSQPGVAIARGFGGLAPYSYYWNTTPVDTDSVAVFTQDSLYTITVTDDRNCERSSAVLIQGPQYLTDFDLQANLVAGNFRPGRTTWLYLDGFNAGCIPVSGQVKLFLSNKTQFDIANPPPDAIVNDTLIWNFNSLTLDSGHIMPEVRVITDTNATQGQAVCMDLLITPIPGDVDTVNNVRNYCYSVINSYDPNDKQVYPTGFCNAGYIADTQRLAFTVRFQNTGNAPAIDVFILDTLDDELDWSSVTVVGNSHTMITEVLDNNVLKFSFPNINLPDSATDEAGSQGYVVFEIMPDTGLVPGNVLFNSAAIYFDFNPPIITNTVINTISDDTVFTTITAFAETVCDSFVLGNEVYYTSGNYSVTLHNFEGCDSVLYLNLTVNKTTATLDTTVCSSYTLPGSGTTVTQSGVYLDTLANTAGCDSVLTINLTVNQVDTTVTQTGDSLLAPNSDTYQWLDCGNNFAAITGATGQAFVAPETGSYAAELQQNGCADTSGCHNIVVSGIVSQTFGPGFRVYPNPTAGHLVIELGAPHELVTLQLSNVSGRIIETKTYHHTAQLSLTLPPQNGYYLMNLTTNNNEVYAVLKLLKQ